MRAAARGFTLIEVLVALVVVAFGMGALMATLTSAADAAGHLRDKSFAEWIALNRVSELRLAKQATNIGKTTGDLEYAGSRWRWTQTVERTAQGGMFQVDVSVTRIAGPGETSQPELAHAIGFLGGSVRVQPTGQSPWSGTTVVPPSPPPGTPPGTQSQPNPSSPPGSPGAPAPGNPPGATPPPAFIPSPIADPDARQ